MKDLFATLYENIIYETDYYLIFQNLFDNGGYINFGLIFIFIPLVLFLLFYFAWKYPYTKLYHWLICLILAFIITAGLTWNIANMEIFTSDYQPLNDALNDSASGYMEFAETLPLKYALINGGISIVLGFIYSLFLKQFSKVQIHLPF